MFDSLKSFILDTRKRSTFLVDRDIAALKHFYEMNDIENISWKKLKRFKGEEKPTNEDRAYTREEIEKLLGVSDPRLKATVLLCCSTGMRIGALGNLLKSHLVEKGDCYKINVYKGLKGKGKYFTFCTPEARRALEDYFQFRERNGEKLGPDSPVFRKEFNTEIPGSARKAEKIGIDSLSRDVWKHLVKAGLREVDHVNIFNRKEVKASQELRELLQFRDLIISKSHTSMIGMYG